MQMRLRNRRKNPRSACCCRTQMEEVSSRYEIFIKRLELSQDPAAKEYLRSTNAQMLEGGFTLGQMFMG